MNAIDINFASAPFRNNTPYWLGYGLGALALAGFTMFNSWAFFAYSESRAILETDHAAKKARVEQLYLDTARLQDLIKKENLEAINSRAAFTNSLLDRRRFSWTELLNNLEEVQPYQVRLLSLLPRIQDKGILVDARAVAKDLQAFWNFQQNLQNHPKFRRVYPGGYQRLEETDEYVFNVQFNYFPAGAPADVQGLTPDQFQIVQAPGAAAEGEVGEEIVEEPPPPPPEPARKGALPGARGSDPTAPGAKGAAELAGAKPPQGAEVPPAGAPPAAPTARVAPPPQPVPAPSAPVVGGIAPGQQVGPGANPAMNAPGAPVIRWPARGALPGSAGQRPPAAAKPEGLPKLPAFQPQAPPPSPEDQPDDGSDADDDGDDGGDE